MKTLLLSLIVVLVLCVNGLSAGLAGTVKSQSGEPVPDVFIFYSRSIRDIVQTDQNGAFTLPYRSRVIFFRRAGYQPLTLIVDSATDRLDVVLNQSSTTEIALPVCSTVKDKGTRIGYSLGLLVPEGSASRAGFDVDYGYFSISYGSEKERVWLEGIYGPMASPGIPPEEWILNAAEFTERSYKGKGLLADMRGKSRDGTYWRYIGALGESIQYSGLSKEAAEYFDKIIDNACVNQRSAN